MPNVLCQRLGAWLVAGHVKQSFWPEPGRYRRNRRHQSRRRSSMGGAARAAAARHGGGRGLGWGGGGRWWSGGGGRRGTRGLAGGVEGGRHRDPLAVLVLYFVIWPAGAGHRQPVFHYYILLHITTFCTNHYYILLHFITSYYYISLLHHYMITTYYYIIADEHLVITTQQVLREITT
jgi:hypothetical protein